MSENSIIPHEMRETGPENKLNLEALINLGAMACTPVVAIAGNAKQRMVRNRQQIEANVILSPVDALAHRIANIGNYHMELVDEELDRLRFQGLDSTQEQYRKYQNS